MSDLENVKNELFEVIEKYLLNYRINLHKEYKLICKEDMLYPQYSSVFTTIDEDEFRILQKKAAELLASSRESACSHVVKHWISIVNGVVPFGYTLKYNDRYEEF